MTQVNADIILKKSTVSGEVPLAADLEVAEVAINTADGKLFTKHTDDSIKEISGKVSSVNGEVGDVSLGIQDMDDFELYQQPPGGFSFVATGTLDQGYAEMASEPNGTFSPQTYAPNTNGYVYSIYFSQYSAEGAALQDEMLAVWGSSSYDNRPVWLAITGVAGGGYVEYLASAMLGNNTHSTLQINFLDSEGPTPPVTPAYLNDPAITVTVAFQDPGVNLDVPLAENDVLRWDDTDQVFRPSALATVATSGSYNDLIDLPAAGAVDSVNGQTGVVSLGIEDMDDFEEAYVDNAANRSWRNKVGSDSWSSQPLGSFNWTATAFRVKSVDSDGTSAYPVVSADPLWVSGDNLLWHRIDGSSWGSNSSGLYAENGTYQQLVALADAENWQEVYFTDTEPARRVTEFGDFLRYDGSSYMPTPLSRAAVTGDYSDLVNLPTIPTRIQDQDDYREAYANGLAEYSYTNKTDGSDFTNDPNGSFYWLVNAFRVKQNDDSGAAAWPSINSSTIWVSGDNKDWHIITSNGWSYQTGYISASGGTYQKLVALAEAEAWEEFHFTATEPTFAPIASGDFLKYQSGVFQPTQLATVATSGSYNDLTDLPASGVVDSVNGQTGTVVLDVKDIGDVGYPPVSSTFYAGDWAKVSSNSADTMNDGTAVNKTTYFRFAQIGTNSEDTLQAFKEWVEGYFNVDFPAQGATTPVPNIEFEVNWNSTVYTPTATGVHYGSTGTNLYIQIDIAESVDISPSNYDHRIYIPGMRAPVGGWHDEEILQYDSATSEWRPVRPTTDTLADVDTSSSEPLDGQSLTFDAASGKFVPTTAVINVGDLADIDYVPASNTLYLGDWAKVHSNAASTMNNGTAVNQSTYFRFARIGANGDDTLQAFTEWVQGYFGVTFPASGQTTSIPNIEFEINWNNTIYTPTATGVTYEARSSATDYIQINVVDDMGISPSNYDHRIYIPGMRTSVGGFNDGDILQWNNANNTWDPVPLPVDSVNGETGAVSLGIQDMDDFELSLDPVTTTYIKTTSESSTSASGWAFGIDLLVLNDSQVDPDGNTVNVGSWAPFGPGTIWMTADDPALVAEPVWYSFAYLGGYSDSGRRIYNNGTWSPSVPSGGNVKWFSNVNPTAATYLPLAEDDILQWDAVAGKFRPAQLPATGAVESVNGETGAVVLNLEDLNDVVEYDPSLNFNGTWVKQNGTSNVAASVAGVDTSAIRFATVSGGVDVQPAFASWAPRVLGVDYPDIPGGNNNVADIPVLIILDGVEYNPTVSAIWNRDEGAYPTVQLSFSDDDGLGGLPGIGSLQLYLPGLRENSISYDGKFIKYDGTTGQWGPAQLATVATSGSYNDLTDLPVITAAPVDSVNGKTGVVSLGIQDMDDYGLRPDYSSVYSFNYANHDPSNTSWVGADGEWGDTTDSGFTRLTFSGVDANGVTVPHPTGNAAWWYSTDNGSSWTSKSSQTWVSLGSAFTVQENSSITRSGNLQITWTDPNSPATLPVADGDVLQYVAADSEFKPTQLATVATSGSYNDLTDLPTGGVDGGTFGSG